MTLADELEAALATLGELEVQCKFWRQAAEHAVRGWNDLEDKVEAAREVLDAIEGNANAARELLGSACEWAPPVPELPHEISPRDFSGLRVVEDETPIGPREPKEG